jgi:hypothetical protein
MTTTFLAFTHDDEVAAIGVGLMDRTLPKSGWTHAAHFATALWLIRMRPDLTPSRDMPPLIRDYNEATGVANTDDGGYHETITQASLRAAADFLADLPEATPLFVACNALLASPLGKTDWLLSYWSKGRLFSVAARRRWMDPDLQALPF